MIEETVDARKIRFDGAAAIAFVRQADEVWIARGKHVRRIEFKNESLADDELLKLILGPSGNLRAPTIRCGQKLFIGFEPQEYAVFLRSRTGHGR